MFTWWAKRPGQDSALSMHVRLHPQAPAADGAHAVGRAAVTFVVIQFVPGGPVEQYLSEAQAAIGGGARRGGSGYRGSQGVDPKRHRGDQGSSTASTSRRTSASGRCWGSFARFDLGTSFFQNKDVWALIMEKLPVSISLGLWTFFISYLIAVPLGVAKAVRAGTRFDFVTTLMVLVGYAIPGFVLGVRCWCSSAASCSGFRCAA